MTLEQDADRERESDIDVRRVLGLLRRQIKLIIAVVLICNALVALMVFQLTPIYEASTLVAVDPQRKDILDPQAQLAGLNEAARVDGDTEILRSPSTMLAVLRSLDPATDPFFQPKVGWRERLARIAGAAKSIPSSEDIYKQALKALSKDVSISRLGQSYLIEVSVRSPDPKRAALLANRIAEVYIAAQIRAKIDAVTASQVVLDNQLETARAQLRSAESKIDTFVEQNLDRVSDPENRTSIARIRDQIANESRERLRLENIAAEASGAIQKGQWAELVAKLDTQNLQRLDQERAKALAELNAVANGSQQAFALRSRLEALEGQLQTEAETAIRGLQLGASKKQQAENDLRRRLSDTVLASGLPNEVLIQLYEVQQEAGVNRGLYENLLSRSKASATQRDLQLPDSRIVSEALPLSDPVFPNKPLLFGLSGLASLMFGIGLAFLRERYIGGFVDVEQVEDVLGVPVVAALPVFELQSGVEDDPVERASSVVRNPLSPYAEGIRHLRLALSLGSDVRSGGEALARVILVTSAVPDEGKTQTALSLARAFALSGKKTILIDCDLRRPSCHLALGREPSAGWSNFLSGRSDEPIQDDLITIDPETGLSMILGGSIAGYPTDRLLESGSLATLLAEARRTFDIVVIDSPPLLPVADARLLLGFADVALIVVRWAATPQQEVRTALHDLQRFNRSEIPILAVLNRVEGNKAGYGYGYDAASYAREPA